MKSSTRPEMTSVGMTSSCARLERRRLGAHTVQVKVRYGDFTTPTRQFSVEEPIIETNDIYRLGCFLHGWEHLRPRRGSPATPA